MHVDILVRRLLLRRLGWFLLVEVEVAGERYGGGGEVRVFRFPPNYLWHERARPLKIQLLELRTSSWSSRFFMLSFVVESDTPTTGAILLILTH